MKTGKLVLLATLTAGLVFGGLPPAAAVNAEPAFPDAVLESPGGPEPLVLPGEVPADALNGGAEPLPAQMSQVPEVSPAPEVSPESTAPAEQAVPLDVADASNAPEETAVPEDDGYEYVPVGEGHVVPGPDTPLVTEADGSVRSAVETEHQHVEPMLARGGAASMLSAAARAGNIKVTLVRATVQGNGNLVNLNSARNSISSASNYWKTMSNGRLSMSVASEKIHRSATAHAYDDYATMMNKIAKELKWVDNPYTALVVFVPTADLRSGGYGGILGGGWTVGGTAGRILMPAPSNFTNNVVTHEFGHVLGLLHANSLQCTNGRSDVGPGSNGRWADGACTSREYGDTTDLMGSAQNHQPVISSYFWHKGSFGQGNEVLDIGEAGSPRTFTLRPWGGSGANRALRFVDPQSREEYYVELRQPAGYDQYLSGSSAGNRGVKIIKADAANSWALNSLIIPPTTKPFSGYYNTKHAWQQGQTFTTHSGSTVAIHSVSSTSASVTVTGSGSAQAKRAIDAVFAANPGTGPAQGGIVGGQKQNGAYRQHQNGTIYFSPSHGAFIVGGAVRSGYLAQGGHNGSLGYPTSSELPGGKGGVYQNFQGGVMYWSPATGARSSPNGEIRQAYARHSYEHGPLGYPTSEHVSLPGGGVFQNFQGGSIMRLPGKTAYASLQGPVRDAYARQGYQNGKLGYPISDEYSSAGGRIQDYQGGRLVYSRASGIHTVSGSIGSAYMAAKGPAGKMGFPTAGEVKLKGGASQQFQKGVIYSSPSTGAVLVPKGALLDRYLAMGAEKSKLGFPAAGQSAVGKGLVQRFQGGTLTWSPATGSRIVVGAINTAYTSLKGPSGSLGFPTGGESVSAGGASQTFEKGTIYWSPSTGALAVKKGALHDVYRKNGAAAGRVGYPVTPEIPIGRNGVYQSFQGGTIYWSPTTGAHLNNGGIRSAYASLGYEQGFLGYPVSGEVKIRNGGVYQSFQGGTIYWSPATGAHANAGGVRAAYARLGWENGFLGYPVSGEVKIRNGGVYQSFQGGTIYWSPGAGGHANAGKIRAAYAAQGWENGRLGYPTSGEYPVPNGSEQTFAGGKITLRNGSAVVKYR
ncbi:M43 family zinc metalloprotease [Arthrobacter caoxuetaonis]|uniref:LGFP repeat-containing protein n=1 Tax=Arthrobacter caoxuetaonis TaxID=2886935 RepID=A0A9X1MEG3_9MICC|nr:M43 family zinc metalloprotease [Arthrobacter caoxuetaonis]MCC3297705.1 hypothetical protein [Arthrobacter caoxuetaonis]USQ56093.1 M43 family zinc metalloprotease [Arthrobacter caoxuetaonis]